MLDSVPAPKFGTPRFGQTEVNPARLTEGINNQDGHVMFLLLVLTTMDELEAPYIPCGARSGSYSKALHRRDRSASQRSICQDHDCMRRIIDPARITLSSLDFGSILH